jgi:hypothetical protein
VIGGWRVAGSGNRRASREINDTALIAVLLLKYLQLRSRFDWSLSNLVALLRMNLFTHRDLWAWLDRPFEGPPAVLVTVQGELALGQSRPSWADSGDGSSDRGVQVPAAYSRKACTSTQPNVVFSLTARTRAARWRSRGTPRTR